MPSSLYRRALESLSEDEREGFGEWGEWLADPAGPIPVKGPKIRANLEAESHLVGEGAFGDPAELAGFLRCCATRFPASSPPERLPGYEALCEEFSGRGLRVVREHLPDSLLRYTSSRTLASILIQRMLGKRARDAFDRESLPLETAFARLRDRWVPSRLEPTDQLHKSNTVFATFEHTEGAPRNDATALSRALALPLWHGPRTGLEMLVELAYPTDAVTGHRFPTVADAGWIHFFHPAPEEAPDAARRSSCCGWTQPLGTHPPQPEIVHDNAPLQVLTEPPRFVGSIS